MVDHRHVPLDGLDEIGLRPPTMMPTTTKNPTHLHPTRPTGGKNLTGVALGGRALRALAPAAQESGTPVCHARLRSGMFLSVYVCIRMYIIYACVEIYRYIYMCVYICMYV